MQLRSVLTVLAVAATIGIGATGCGRGGSTSATDGITDTEVHLGGTWVFSGPRGVYGPQARAVEAYFKYVNDRGGVMMADGKPRKITETILDDGGDAARASANIRKLVEEDHVFALYPNYGNPVLATRKLAAEMRVPQPFTFSVATATGADIKQYPYTLPWQMAGATEGALWAKFLKDTKPHARVALLYINVDSAVDQVKAFKRLLRGTGIKIVGTQTYEATDTDVRTQVTKLSTTKADVLVDISPAGFVPPILRQIAHSTWKPLHIVPSFAADTGTVIKPAGAANALGLVAAKYELDPNDPAVATSPAIRRYRVILRKYAPSLDPDQGTVLEGLNTAQTVVKALERAQPTRESFNHAVHHMRGVKLDWLMPGITVTTGPDDGFPIESAQLEQFTGAKWKPLGGIVSYEAQTMQLGQQLGD